MELSILSNLFLTQAVKCAPSSKQGGHGLDGLDTTSTMQEYSLPLLCGRHRFSINDAPGQRPLVRLRELRAPVIAFFSLLPMHL
jgi:hypothetical protein